MWIEVDVNYHESNSEERIIAEIDDGKCVVESYTYGLEAYKAIIFNDTEKRQRLVKNHVLCWFNIETNQHLVLKKGNMLSGNEWRVYLLENSKFALQICNDNFDEECHRFGEKNIHYIERYTGNSEEISIKYEETGEIGFVDAEYNPFFPRILKTFDNLINALEYTLLIVGKELNMSYTGNQSSITKLFLYNYCYMDKKNIRNNKSLIEETQNCMELVENNNFLIEKIQEDEIFADRLCDVLHIAGYESEMRFYLCCKNNQTERDVN